MASPQFAKKDAGVQALKELLGEAGWSGNISNGPLRLFSFDLAPRPGERATGAKGFQIFSIADICHSISECSAAGHPLSLYEMSFRPTDDFPRPTRIRPHVDVDVVVAEEPSQEEKEDYIASYREAVGKCFAELLHVDIDPASILVQTAFGEHADGYKMSLHIVVNQRDVVFGSLDDQRSFWETAASQELIKDIDLCIYQGERSWRLLGCRKVGGTRVLQQHGRESTAIDVATFKQHSLFPDHEEDNLLSVPPEWIHARKQRGGAGRRAGRRRGSPTAIRGREVHVSDATSVAFMSEFKSNYPGTDIIEVGDEEEYRTFSVRSISGEPYFCPYKQSEHASNNVYIVLSKVTGVVKWKCHDEECRGKEDYGKYVALLDALPGEPLENIRSPVTCAHIRWLLREHPETVGEAGKGNKGHEQILSWLVRDLIAIDEEDKSRRDPVLWAPDTVTHLWTEQKIVLRRVLCDALIQLDDVLRAGFCAEQHEAITEQEDGSDTKTKLTRACHSSPRRSAKVTGLNVFSGNNAFGVLNKIIPVLCESFRRVHWNDDPFVFSCANGVIDARTASFAPRTDAHLFRDTCGVAFDADADTSDIERLVLSSMKGSKEMTSFLQVILGSMLRGGNPHQLFILFVGSGSNGKSKLIEALQGVFGRKYGIALPKEIMVKQRARGGAGGVTPHLELLRGRRLAYTEETSSDDVVNEALIKQITGGTEIVSRGLYREFSSMRVTALPILCTNHDPRMPDDEAFWRRVVYVEFPVRFVPHEPRHDLECPRDDALVERVLSNPQGTLKWLFDGLRRLCEDPTLLQQPQWPEEARMAKEEIREESNTFGSWFSTLQTIDSAFLRYADAFEDFRTTAEVNWTKGAFSRRMKAEGHQRKRKRVDGKQTWGYENLALPLTSPNDGERGAGL